MDRPLGKTQELCKRLNRLGDAFDARSAVTKKFKGLSFISSGDNGTARTTLPRASKHTSILEAIGICFAFDEDLESSRVYRNAKNEERNRSFVSSTSWTRTWSIFSGLSLADISETKAITYLPMRDHCHPNLRLIGKG